jgi:predicted dehydrogenase
MSKKIKVSVIGLDTSHGIELPRRIQAPDCDPAMKVEGLQVIKCLRFLTPFTDDKTLAERQAQLEDWNVQVTENFDEAVDGAEALIVSINDGSYHLEYFEKCAGLGIPIFLDKPMADTVSASQKISEIAQENGTSFFTASSLRFGDQIVQAGKEVSRPSLVTIYGPLGIAPAGSSIVWYGVHAFEMLESLLGTGAELVTVVRDKKGAVAHITYADDRRGIVELTEGNWQYGGTVRNDEKVCSFLVDSDMNYTRILQQMIPFFQGGTTPVMVNHSLEIIKLLEATQKSYDTGKPVSID